MQVAISPKAGLKTGRSLIARSCLSGVLLIARVWWRWLLLALSSWELASMQRLAVLLLLAGRLGRAQCPSVCSRLLLVITTSQLASKVALVGSCPPSLHLLVVFLA